MRVYINFLILMTLGLHLGLHAIAAFEALERICYLGGSSLSGAGAW